MGKRSWNEKLGKCHFTLAFILLLNMQSLPGGHTLLSSRCLPNPHDISNSIQDFTSWIIWGKSGEPSSFLSHSRELALILLRHGQYDAAKVIILPSLWWEPLYYILRNFSETFCFCFFLFVPLILCKVPTHNGGGTFTEGEDISKYSR